MWVGLLQPPASLFSNGNANKPFCRRLVNHFMDLLKQKKQAYSGLNKQTS